MRNQRINDLFSDMIHVIFYAAKRLFLPAILLMLFNCSSNNELPETFLCVSVKGESLWHGLAVSEGMAQLLKSNLSENKNVLSAEDIYQAVRIDTVSHISTFYSLALRAGIKHIIAAEPVHVEEEYSEIRVVHHDFSANHADTLMYVMNADGIESSWEEMIQYFFPESQQQIEVPQWLKEKEIMRKISAVKIARLSGRHKEAEMLSRQLVSTVKVPEAYIELIKSTLEVTLDEKVKGGFVKDNIAFINNHINAAITENPDDPRFYLLQGRAFILDNRWSRAEAALLKAARHDPHNSHVYFYLSRLHHTRFSSLGFSSKTDVLQRCLYLNPFMIKAYVELIRLGHYQNRFSRAEAAFHKGLEIVPDSVELLLSMGKFYVMHNNIAKLIEIYERVLEIDPQNVVAFYNLGIAYYNDDKPEIAEAFFRRAVRFEDHADSKYYLGVIRLEAGDSSEALSYFRERVRQRKGDLDMFADEAAEYIFRLGQNDTE